MPRILAVLMACGALLLPSCATSERALVQDIPKHQDLPQFRLQSIAGTRDGDRLRAEAIISDSSSILAIEMQFAIGSPTTLQSGAWRWEQTGQLATGVVQARSVTFLGGQDGPPSIGGTFDLIDSGGEQRYRVNLPVSQLTRR
jgi:hypothetical protein